MTLYETLGVDLKATYAQIKHAYRKLAKTKHPDVGGTAEEFDVIKNDFHLTSLIAATSLSESKSGH